MTICGSKRSRSPERWKDTYVSDLEISTWGTPRNKITGRKIIIYSERIKNPKSIYIRWFIKFPENNKGKRYRIATLVARTFCEGYNITKKEVDHINRISTDNYYKNLRWCSHKQNMFNRIGSGVYYTSKTDKGGWRYTIRFPNLKTYQSKLFKTSKEAQLARNKKLEEFHNEGKISDEYYNFMT